MPEYPPARPSRPAADFDDTTPERAPRNWALVVFVGCAIIVLLVGTAAAIAVFGKTEHRDRPAASSEWTPPQFNEGTTPAEPASAPTPTNSPSAIPAPPSPPPSYEDDSPPPQSYAPAPYPTVRPTTNLPRPGAQGGHDGLLITVTGTCANGGLKLDGRGFTPGGMYLTQVWYPHSMNYVKYTHLLNNGNGIADGDGRTTHWSWDCKDGANGQPDPKGVYTLLMVDFGPDGQGPYRWAYTTFEVK